MQQPPTQVQPLAADLAQAVGRVFDLYDPPLWLVTSTYRGRRGGLIATFAVRASIVATLPRMVIGIAKHHHTWGLIQESGGFALHLLQPDRLDLIRRFALVSGHQVDKFAGLPETLTPDGQPLIADALAWLDCRCEARLDSGDRTVYLAAVTGGAATAETATSAMTVRGLFDTAPLADRTRLNALYARDGQIDGAAILAWRDLQANGPA